MTETFLNFSSFSFPVNECLFNPSLLAKPDGGYWVACRKDALDPVFLAHPQTLSPAQYLGLEDGQHRGTGRRTAGYRARNSALRGRRPARVPRA